VDERELRGRALELRQVAAELVAKVDAVVALMDADGVTVPRQGMWTPSKLEQIRGCVDENPGLKGMFTLLSGSPGTWITYSTVLDSTGRTDREMRSDLRLLSRTTRKLFSEKSWPFEAEQGPLAASGRWEMTYRMDPVVARWWEISSR
jgi:hypothetical protein